MTTQTTKSCVSQTPAADTGGQPVKVGLVTENSTEREATPRQDTQTTPETKLLEGLEAARKKLAARNYDRAGLAVDEVIGCLIDYYAWKEMKNA